MAKKFRNKYRIESIRYKDWNYGYDGAYFITLCTKYRNKFGLQSNNISSIIRGFKSKVTVRARKIDPGFAWQPGYYDRVIRDVNEFRRIRKYIMEDQT